jgi:membrane fusion protein (multidrug efflux system)
MSSITISRPGTVSLSICLALILTLGGCASPETGSDQAGTDATPVSVHTVQAKTLKRTVEAVGTLKAVQTVQISPEIAGRIETLSFREGDTTAKGDTLVQLDDNVLQQQYQVSVHALDEAQANLENARQSYQRNKRLYGKDMIAEQQLDNAEAGFEAVKARVERLRAQMKQARERLQDATLHAPFMGVLGAQQVDQGNYIQPGTPITTLYRTERLEIQFSVPERYGGQLHRGQTVRILSSSSADTGMSGEVYFVSPSVSETTRDILVKAHIENGKHRLKPGAFVDVELILEKLRNRPVVPAEALIGTREGYIVYQVENGVARRQPVSIGLRRLGHVEITKGLKPGDRVIQSGHIAVSDGMEVTPTNSGSNS